MEQAQTGSLTGEDLRQASIDLMVDYAMVYGVRELGYKRGDRPGRDAMVDSYVVRWRSVAMFLAADGPKNPVRRAGVRDRDIVACDFDAAWDGSKQLHELRLRVDKQLAHISLKRRYQRTGEGEDAEEFLNDGNWKNRQLDALTATLHEVMELFLQRVGKSDKLDRDNKHVKRALKYHKAFKKKLR